jgi:ABC-type polar amino acid transport system ATPase subunit
MSAGNARATDAAEPMIEVRGLQKQYDGRAALGGVDLTVQAGEITFFIGPSGAGKSTLLRCINFLEHPTRGEIRFCGETLCHEREQRLHVAPERVLRQARSRMPMVFQQFNLFEHRTVLENIIEGPVHVQGKSRDRAIEEALQELRRVGLLDKQDSYPDQLSGGQKQRVAIARALAMQPALILFDEPTSSLDPQLVSEVLSIIRSLAEEGRTMLVVTHEMRFARQLAHRIHFFVDGRIVESGTPDEIFDAPRHARLREFVSAGRTGT